jgi:ceramide glucosyltransferase
MQAALAMIPTMIITALGWALLALATIGTLYMVATTISFWRFFGQAKAPPRRNDAVTLLKPLHGAQPRLADNLGSFLVQEHDGPVQMLCGVHRADDPAIQVIDSLRAAHADAAIDLVVDPAGHGANGKISNLINMAPRIKHPLLVLSDSDIAAAPDYLARILAALDAPGVGAVTCLYRGRGDAGFWSRLGAAGVSWQFLPGAVFGVSFGLAQPCMGSTIALRRETLDRLGGFDRFKDMLADDYEIGQAVRALGLTVAVPPMLVTHGSDETSLGALWRHELRWGATVRDVVPAAYAASVIGMPFPLAVLGTALAPAHLSGVVIALMALLVRMVLAGNIDARAGERTAGLWLLPMRDCLTFVVFVASYFVRSVDWRGQRLKMEENGRIAADTEIPA